jgi:cell division protein FtsN
MNKIYLIGIPAAVLVVAIGALFAITWDMPAPTQQVEKVVPDERFPR